MRSVGVPQTMVKIVEGYAAKMRVSAGKRDVQVFDDALPGFGIRKFDSGKAFFFVKYSVGHQQRKLSLGPVVQGSLAEKRKLASEILSRARIGQDVAAEKQAATAAHAKRAATLGSVIPRYLKERQGELRKTTFADAKRYLERYWQPLHGHAIDAIQRSDVAVLIDDLATKHGKVAADRARTALSTLFSWAIDRNYLGLNPVQNFSRRSQGEARDRVLSEAELVAVWKGCRADDYGRIVRLLILTGQRKTEIGDLERAEINADKRQLELPAQRTNNRRPHVIPLSCEALVILQDMPQRDGLHVFGQGVGGFSGWSKAKAKLDKRLSTQMAPWTVHDIRRSVVTHLNECGFAQPHVIESIVNHVSGGKGGVAGVYNKAVYLAERRKALDLWDQHVAALVEGRRGNVVPFRGGAIG